MDCTPEAMGWKLYGLYNFSRLGLFNRPFLILDNFNDSEKIVKLLKDNNFKDEEAVAVRFSKENKMHLPFFLGNYSLNKIAELIIKEKADYVPFVHGLVKSKFSMGLYCDSDVINIEIWPGIGASKTEVFNVTPDVIRIKNSIKIFRYNKKRKVEDVFQNVYLAEPFDFEFLENLAERLVKLKPKIINLLEICNPLLADLNCESLEDINFMGIQKTEKLEFGSKNYCSDFFIVKTLDDLEKYDGQKELFIDISLRRGGDDIHKIIDILKNFSKVYVKSLTMHLAVVLREFGVNLEKAEFKNDYDIKEVVYNLDY